MCDSVLNVWLWVIYNRMVGWRGFRGGAAIGGQLEYSYGSCRLYYGAIASQVRRRCVSVCVCGVGLVQSFVVLLSGGHGMLPVKKHILLKF